MEKSAREIVQDGVTGILASTAVVAAFNYAAEVQLSASTLLAEGSFVTGVGAVAPLAGMAIRGHHLSDSE